MPKIGRNIYKRKDGRWEVRIISGYKPNGKAKYKSLQANSYAEAKRKQAVAQARITSTVKTENYLDVSFEQASVNWLSAQRVKVKESTYTKYERLLRTQRRTPSPYGRASQLNNARSRLSAYVA
jgi:hypothetical protein